jgi:hypothetical protein
MYWKASIHYNKENIGHLENSPQLPGKSRKYNVIRIKYTK